MRVGNVGKTASCPVTKQKTRTVFCAFKSESGGIGRRAGFRFQWDKTRESSSLSFRTRLLNIMNMGFKDELLDVVDDNDNVVGQEYRSVLYESNTRNFRFVNGFFRKSSGELWIPRRTARKRFFPNCLDMSVGGHVAAGEDYDSAFFREMVEETGVRADEVQWRVLGHLEPREHGVFSWQRVYEVSIDFDPVFNPDDIQEAYWMQPDELVRRISDGEPAKGDLPRLVTHFYLKTTE